MRVILATLFAFITGPALSEAIPRLDVEEICRSNMSRRSSPEIAAQQYDRCFTEKQSDYDALKVAWRHITEAEQRDCIALQRSNPNYGSLRRCAEQTIERNDAAQVVRSPMPKREFRY